MKGKQDKPVAEKAAPELTRREWLLRLSEITALAGVAGLVPEMATTLAGAEQQVAGALPPGLYEPSPRHLIHALSGQGAAAIPSGSETDYVQPRLGQFHPRFFSPEEFRVVTRLAEVLLGTVDASTLAETAEWIDVRIYSAAGAREAARRLDPLHRALAVAYYGEAQVVELETSDPQFAARTGIGALEEHCRTRLGHAFLELSASGQEDVVREIRQTPQETPLRRFYDLMRREAIRGYYTSRRGLKELDYKGNSYYSQCPGCEKA
ncbi:MAG TPA: gluconate 2-dehydrogenase subunit 3 family protein [Terriglobales bacterium]|nr:gluconate 2-dehydrogenase subunit 3 family protein [Terriglobales bacterium]